MSTTALKRQFITDADGTPVAVILPIEEFVLIKDVLDQRRRTTDEADKLAQMEQAAQDPLFLADLRETMSAFSDADGEWWEPLGYAATLCRERNPDRSSTPAP